MLKSDLRKKYLAKRSALPEESMEAHSLEILRLFIDFFKPRSGTHVNIFLPIVKFREINTWHFVRWFFQNNISVSVPKVEGELISAKDLLPGTELITNKWGIAEPQSSSETPVSKIDMVITPLLYCDFEGNRVGYGKGFYDRFFAELNPETLKVGLNYFPPNEQIDDKDQFDIPLDYLLTPDEVLSFGSLGSKVSK